MYRTPGVTSTVFGDVSIFWYMNQGDNPAGPTRGHLMDHMALSVTDLDAWITKLRAEGVTFLEQPYKVGEYRAVMIEGPSREAIELIEVGPDQKKMDLLIATSAVVDGAALVTANRRHFDVIPGLEVFGY